MNYYYYYYNLLQINFLLHNQSLLNGINNRMCYSTRLFVVIMLSLIVIYIKVIRILLYLLKTRQLRQRTNANHKELQMLEHILTYEENYRYLLYFLFPSFFIIDGIMVESIATYPKNIIICILLFGFIYIYINIDVVVSNHLVQSIDNITFSTFFYKARIILFALLIIISSILCKCIQATLLLV